MTLTRFLVGNFILIAPFCSSLKLLATRIPLTVLCIIFFSAPSHISADLISQEPSAPYTTNNHQQQVISLLTTHTGGLSINLTPADKVVLYDSDWCVPCNSTFN